jgi:NAD(P)-dependent dehydrogenase (short-subunit alcohol dehydrogenase family)
LEISLEGRTALVTGGGRGIGRAIALSLAEAGADVAVNFRRDQAAAEQTVADIRALGRKAKAYQASVEDWGQDEAMAAAVLEDFGTIDILVNNAGAAPRGGFIADTDLAEINRLMGVLLFAPVYLCKLLVPQMRQRPRGDIIMISSIATLDLPAGGGGYNLGKAAGEALAFTLAKEERAFGIRANVVAPGLTVTDMGARGVQARGEGDIHDLDAASPFGRVSVPSDVASAVTWLVSDANPYVNGQKLYVNGGG